MADVVNFTCIGEYDEARAYDQSLLLPVALCRLRDAAGVKKSRPLWLS